MRTPWGLTMGSAPWRFHRSIASHDASPDWPVKVRCWIVHHHNQRGITAHCPLTLHTVFVHCLCPQSLPTVSAHCPCTLSLHTLCAHSSCTLSLHNISAHCLCPLSVHSVFGPSNWTLSAHWTILHWNVCRDRVPGTAPHGSMSRTSIHTFYSENQKNVKLPHPDLSPIPPLTAASKECWKLRKNAPFPTHTLHPLSQKKEKLV